jgi:hypothetical protein
MALGVGEPMRGTIGFRPGTLRQRPGVAPVRLDLATAGPVHWGEVRVGPRAQDQSWPAVLCTSMPIWSMAPLLAALTALHPVGQHMPPRRVGVSHFIRSEGRRKGESDAHADRPNSGSCASGRPDHVRRARSATVSSGHAKGMRRSRGAVDGCASVGSAALDRLWCGTQSARGGRA